MPRGQPLNTMNPFSNNKPRLTASERIRNKRDAAIYQGEKQRFQRGKNKCRNRNVKFYKNGKVRSVINYKMQKSLARGNVLCNDCDDKGNLCAPPSKKDDLASINMGNNNYSEFWGGGSVLNWAGGNPVTQTPADVVINSDVSGSWDPSSNSWKGAISLCGPSNNLVCPYGYLNNLIKIPRNLDGSGIIIDPSNILFPDALCDPFRYLKRAYLKTYLVITTGLVVEEVSAAGILDFVPSRCNDKFYPDLLIGETAVAQRAAFGTTTAFGTLASVCCIGGIPVMIPYFGYTPVDANNTTTAYGGPPDNFGLYKIYIEASEINLERYVKAMKLRNNLPFRPWVQTLFDDDIIVNITYGGPGWGDAIIWPWLIQSINIIQGSIPPSQNQTKYNATRQSYMYCLENGTRKINFTKQNTRIPVKNAFCTPYIPGPPSPSPPACVPEISFTTELVVPGPAFPVYQNLPDGTYLLFDIGPGNTNTTWNFNIIDISNSCPGEPANLKIDYLVVGGGGSGGYSFGPGQRGTTGGGGGGGVQQGTLPTLSGGTTYNFQVEVGAGSPGTLPSASSQFYSGRFVTDASSSRLAIGGLGAPFQAVADPGQNGALVTYPKDQVGTGGLYLFSTEGGQSGGSGVGGIIIDPSTDTPVDGSSNPIVFGSAGGGGSNQDGSNNGVFGDTSTWYESPSGRYFTSGGNGGDGVSSSITGSTVSYGGGGGGAARGGIGTIPPGTTISAGQGGEGGGGNGALFVLAVGSGNEGDPGTQYGGGGGGSAYEDIGGPTNGGAGYRGVVILKFYKAPA